MIQKDKKNVQTILTVLYTSIRVFLKKKRIFDFLSGYPLIWCIWGKKYHIQNFIHFDAHLGGATDR